MDSIYKELEAAKKFYGVYADKDCPSCAGVGCYVIIDAEPYGDTYVDIPKGVDECSECVRPKLRNVDFCYYCHATRKGMAWADPDNIPF